MQAARETYHHGDLRQALINAALELVEEVGIDNVSMREAGRRAGVSAAAPFRHFSNKVELMTAVAEEAMRRFRAEIDSELMRTVDLDPLSRFRALGTAYLRWAVRSPTHFEVISTRRAIDFGASDVLVQTNADIRALMTGLLEQARDAGQLRVSDIGLLVLQARALAYGLARIWVDGQFAQWGGVENAEKLMRESLDGYIALLSH